MSMMQAVKERTGKAKSGVQGWMKKLFEERKAGTGPHSGKHGPLVTDPKRIEAIAYAKERRGE